MNNSLQHILGSGQHKFGSGFCDPRVWCVSIANSSLEEKEKRFSWGIHSIPASGGMDEQDGTRAALFPHYFEDFWAGLVCILQL